MEQHISPVVSVIMPAYNASEFIGRAIDSVLAQTTESWELIVVDDGSTDNTAAIAGAYYDDRIIVISQPNGGLPAARNAGIRAAKGELLGFLDADDEWMPAFLSKCLAVLGAASDADIVGVYASHSYIDGESKELPQEGNAIVPAENLHGRLVRSGFFPPCVVLVQTKAVRAVGCFDESLRKGLEDQDLWIRLTESGIMVGIDEPLARYRVHGNNMSGRPADMHIARMAVLRKHFGPPVGDVRDWPDDKRIAYAGRYFSSAMDYMVAGDSDRGWELLAQSVSLDEQLALAPDPYFRVLYSQVPRGYWGRPMKPDSDTAMDLLARTRQLCDDAGVCDPGVVRLAEANARLALAMVYDTSGEWALGRRHQWRALLGHRSMAGDISGWRRLLKLCLGSRVGRWYCGTSVNESQKMGS